MDYDENISELKEKLQISKDLRKKSEIERKALEHRILLLKNQEKFAILQFQNTKKKIEQILINRSQAEERMKQQSMSRKKIRNSRTYSLDFDKRRKMSKGNMFSNDNSNKKEDKSMVDINLINETVDRLYEKANLCETIEEAEVYINKAEELLEAVEVEAEDSYDLGDLINETVDRLYEKAALCESSDEAEVYIVKAEELQKAIDDIPEEAPIVDDEYPEEVSGGPGEDIDQEEIKDLIGDDAEALKLLNCDTQSMTIDA